MPNTKRSLGEKLRELRENYDLSQGQVAAALNIDRSTYTYYELDKTQPSLETLVKLSHIFNVPKVVFLPDDDEDDEEAAALRDLFQPNSMVRSLSKDERGILVLYRAMTRQQRAQIHDEMLKITKPGRSHRQDKV